MDFSEHLQKYSNLIDGNLKLLLSNSTNSYESKIYESMKYSLLSGGKRIRPVLLLETGISFGATIDELLDFACSMEMIHTYSLIHDDLPAMDDDDLRRGNPTNHIVYGEAIAILAGDALLNTSFETMIGKAVKSNNMKYLKAIEVISKSSGIHGMIGGQVADILSENVSPDKETLNYIHMNKTSALLTASIVAGGYIAGVSDDIISKLYNLGNNIGLSFQIRDDILDIESTVEKLGKPIGSDEKNKKMTYPSLYGLEESKMKIKELHENSIGILNSLDVDVDFLKHMVDFLYNRDY